MSITPEAAQSYRRQLLWEALCRAETLQPDRRVAITLRRLARKELRQEVSLHRRAS